MRMIIRSESVMRAEALTLAATGNRLRVTVAGHGETEEWLMIDGCWYDENGRRVKIEAVSAVD